MFKLYLDLDFGLSKKASEQRESTRKTCLKKKLSTLLPSIEN